MRKHVQNQSGFLLILLLGSIALIGIAVTVAAEQWTMISRRAKEAELLYRGGRIYLAIQRYSGKVPGVPQYPEKLEDLLKDPRSQTTIRYLRKITKDPITGEDWIPILAGNGRIMGVRSSSHEKPIKQDGFPPEFKSFKDANHYCRWEFKFVPGQPVQTPTLNAPASTQSGGDSDCPAD